MSTSDVVNWFCDNGYKVEDHNTKTINFSEQVMNTTVLVFYEKSCLTHTVIGVTRDSYRL